MQAAIYFQKKDFSSMQESFEAAVKHGNKESLMWAAYAWCLIQNKQSDQAQARTFGEDVAIVIENCR